MNQMRFQLAFLLASALIAGCSSRVELDVEHEKTDIAVNVEDHVTAVSQQSRTQLRFGAQNTVTDPVVSEKVETPVERIIAAAETPPTEVRQQEAVQRQEPAHQVETTITTIEIGDIHIHVGDNTQVHQHTQVQTQAFNADTSLVEQPPVFLPQRRLKTTSSRPQRGDYHERLRMEHEMRVRQWQSLFQ